MDWENYIKSEIEATNCLCDLKIGFKENKRYDIGIPAIIKASIQILDKLINAGEKYITIVFPEKSQSAFLMAILRIIYDFFNGNAEKYYNPYTFAKGQKLKCKNCVVEFDRIEQSGDKILLWIKDADLSDGIPLELAPFFQLTDTNRRLSPDKEFSKVKKEIINQKQSMPENDKLVASLIDYKTYLNHTIFYVAPISTIKDILPKVTINGKQIEDILLIGQSDQYGNIEIINKGQLTGEPAIVLASNLYAAYEAIKRNNNAKSLFIDVSNTNAINSELDVLDEFLKEDFPIICLTDTVNSFELNMLEIRKFNIWRWDEESITRDMYKNEHNLISEKEHNCAEQEVEYIKCECNEISQSVTRLNNYRKEIADTTPDMFDIFGKLFSLAFDALRNLTNLSDGTHTKVNTSISDCKIKLQRQKRFITKDMFNDFQTVIASFETIYNKQYEMPKISALRKILISNPGMKFCILIPDRTDKKTYEIFWGEEFTKCNINVNAVFLHLSEYYNCESNEYDITICCGWFNNKIMRRIIYSYNTSHYIILLYDCELNWKNPDIKKWSMTLHNRNNQEVIEKVLHNYSVDIPHFQDRLNIENNKNEQDELNDIELVLRENKYKKYLYSGESTNTEEIIEVIPVNYIGGYFAFYKLTHKLISVTGIVFNKKNEIENAFPEDLEIGDFIVVRESEHDLVKEFADTILSNSGKGNLRKLATEWKETLQLESIFSSFEEIYNKLKNAGCTKDKITVKSWMNNDDIISPQNVEDLKYIAEAMEDDVLSKKYKEVFNAGKEVKRAHVQTGKILSELLKRKIAQKIKEIGDIDPYNIWDPIPLYLEEIGMVKILKVIDIGSKVMVSAKSSNILLKE